MKLTNLEFENDLYERFLKSIQIDSNGCWNWENAKYRGGYGVFRVGRKTFRMSSHRYSYSVHRGPVPEGLVIDHLCRNPSCCNPEHLEAVTQRENMARGLVVARRKEVSREQMRPIMLAAQKKAVELFKARKHCRKGHELTPENTNIVEYKPGSTTRTCRECRRLVRKKEWAAIKARKLSDGSSHEV